MPTVQERIDTITNNVMARGEGKRGATVHDLLAIGGINGCRGAVIMDEAPAGLIERALRRNEGVLTDAGALSVETGKYTGRSPEDRFIVDTPDVHDNIHWGSVNKPFSPENYEKVKEAVTEYLRTRDIFVVRAIAGADRRWCRKFLIVCERASQALFARQLLVRPSKRQRDDYFPQDYTVLAAPDLKLDPEKYGTNSEAAVLINFEDHTIIVAGTAYSGEIKKAVFSVMNYVMPIEENVLPMHSSANMDPVTGETAVFFGLSGTGKTTLSADTQRVLIGDDEHGWAQNSIFNFEGGCYAKAIKITPVTEPQIYGAIRFGAICENVVVNHVSRRPDFFDDSLTENTRVAYPVDYIDNAAVMGQGRYPNVVIFLTADAFGVLPPISRLDKNAAMFHFHDFGHHPIHKIAVVRHNQHGSGVVLQIPLQPGHGTDVQMVGGLVQKNEIRLGKQQLAQGHPGLFAAGKHPAGLVKIFFGKAQAFNDTGNLAAEGIAPFFLKTVGEAAVAIH